MTGYPRNSSSTLALLPLNLFNIISIFPQSTNLFILPLPVHTHIQKVKRKKKYCRKKGGHEQKSSSWLLLLWDTEDLCPSINFFYIKKNAKKKNLTSESLDRLII